MHWSPRSSRSSPEDLRQCPPARLTVAIDERRKEREDRGQKPRADLDGVGVEARALPGRLENQGVIPLLDRPAVLARCDLVLSEPLDAERMGPSRQDAEESDA